MVRRRVVSRSRSFWSLFRFPGNLARGDMLCAFGVARRLPFSRASGVLSLAFAGRGALDSNFLRSIGLLASFSVDAVFYSTSRVVCGPSLVPYLLQPVLVFPAFFVSIAARFPATVVGFGRASRLWHAIGARGRRGRSPDLSGVGGRGEGTFLSRVLVILWRLSL